MRLQCAVFNLNNDTKSCSNSVSQHSISGELGKVALRLGALFRTDWGRKGARWESKLKERRGITWTHQFACNQPLWRVLSAIFTINHVIKMCFVKFTFGSLCFLQLNNKIKAKTKRQGRSWLVNVPVIGWLSIGDANSQLSFSVDGFVHRTFAEGQFSELWRFPELWNVLWVKWWLGPLNAASEFLLGDSKQTIASHQVEEKPSCLVPRDLHLHTGEAVNSLVMPKCKPLHIATIGKLATIVLLKDWR